jgi:hypothetical protein
MGRVNVVAAGVPSGPRHATAGSVAGWQGWKGISELAESRTERRQQDLGGEQPRDLTELACR